LATCWEKAVCMRLSSPSSLHKDATAAQAAGVPRSLDCPGTADVLHRKDRSSRVSGFKATTRHPLQCDACLKHILHICRTKAEHAFWTLVVALQRPRHVVR
jgi:hypothetical protein